MPGITGLSGLTGLSAIFGAGYANKVLSYGPIAYWPLWEAAGNVARCLVNSPAQDGTYIGVALGQPGIGDGNTCPFFDGANDVVDISTAAFVAAFNGAEGSLAIWARVFNVGVWTDGTQRYLAQLRTDDSNLVQIRRSAANNRFWPEYIAGGVVEGIDGGVAGLPVAWMHWGATWSKSAGANGEVKWYLNGVQWNPTHVALGVWAGNLNANTTTIGSKNTAPNGPWHGWLQHPAVWDRPLASADMLDLATR